jgi:predicted ATPase/DNA-binding XRE family transcriptional regulator
MSPSPQQFGAWLKQLRNQHELTQEALAELANCSVQTIRFFESGKRRPSFVMAEQLAALLAVPAAERATFVALARQPLPAADMPTDEARAEVGASPSRAVAGVLPTLEQVLIGREAEQNVLRQLLLEEERRLVTIVGAGGMGKTHLALHVATTLATHFTDGAAFVPLAALRTAAHLPGAIANALTLTLGSDDPSAQVLAALAARHLLLVLDGFEELLHQEEGAAATWVNLLLQQAPRVQILLTSRERLRLSYERTFELAGLALPTAAVAPETADAVLLFRERAQQATPEFSLDNSNRAAVVRICQLVDGMPLAIELAAAWVRVITPQELADELAQNVDVLARANRDTTPRHRSMRAVFDHSWALLNEQERAILGRLAVFRGGCYREAAQAVAGATLPLLAGLIDKSLVRRRQSTGHARYELHEVVRQFAAGKRRQSEATSQYFNTVLPHTANQLEQDEAWLAHYQYFYKLAEKAKAHLHGPEQVQWLQVLDDEQANLWAALDRCVQTGDNNRGLQLAIQLDEYWYTRAHHHEGLQRLLAFLPDRATAQLSLNVVTGLATAGILAIAGGNYIEAEGYIERSVAGARSLGEQQALARVLRYQGIVALHAEDFATAERIFTEAVAAANTIADRYESATTLSHLAEIALVQEQYARAQQLGEEAVDLLRKIEDRNQLAGALRRLAQARIYQGDWGAARQNALESLALNCEVRDQRGTAASIVVLATLLERDAQWPLIAQLLGAADALLTQVHASLLPADRATYQEIHRQTSAKFADFATAHEAGYTRIAEAVIPCDLGWVQQFFVQ